MTLDEFLFSEPAPASVFVNNENNTRTYTTDRATDRLHRVFGTDLVALKLALGAFNRDTEHLRAVPRHSLYREFYIPKSSGGLRKIDAPNDELMAALRRLKGILETDFHALYHTSAFAYVKHRSTVDAVKRHQMNESKWFAKFDLSNFFGSTTLDFCMSQLAMIYPFSELIRWGGGEELRKALELGFLDGGLPQGTPLSPALTNILMIPIDHALSNSLRDFGGKHFIYTRYADDFLISSRTDFRFRDVEQHIRDTLARFSAPYIIKPEKTRYGSSAGSNWNLGLMLNKNNEITIGSKKKRQFRAMLTSFVLDTRNGRPWDPSDIRVMDGLRSYYRMVEGKTIDDIVDAIGRKFGADIPQMIKAGLNPTA